jgi:hypothetical protein
MTDVWRNALWQQFGAAIDTLDDAVRACPDSLWSEPVWIDYSDHPVPEGYTAFWNIAYHTLFWLDLYLFGTGEGFAPPAPFTLSELDPAGVVPDPPYDKDLLRRYLADIRARCQTILTALTDEPSARPCRFPWGRGQSVSYFELQLYNLRHVQEHAAQLHLFLGQHVPETTGGWVARARG